MGLFLHTQLFLHLFLRALVLVQILRNLRTMRGGSYQACFLLLDSGLILKIDLLKSARHGSLHNLLVGDNVSLINAHRCLWQVGHSTHAYFCFLLSPTSLPFTVSPTQWPGLVPSMVASYHKAHPIPFMFLVQTHVLLHCFRM